MKKLNSRINFPNKSLYLFGLSGLSLVSCQVLPGKANEQPNIVLIMVDDMGYSDIGCYGGEISTPHLDKLAENGIRYTQFYNAARCVPTRASLLTGLYPHQTGIGAMNRDDNLPGYRGELNNHCVTIAQVLKTAGYSTYMTGKYHVARTDISSWNNWPIQRGFDRFFGTVAGGGNFFKPDGLMLNNEFVEPGPGFYYTFDKADYSAKFIREHQQDKKSSPFFLYVAFTAPHWPLHAPDSLIERYSGMYDGGWDQIRTTRLKKMKQLGILPGDYNLSDRDSSLPAWEDIEEKEWEARRMEVYAAQVEAMDMGVGTIIEALKETGQLDNTLILFLSDNGGCAEELDDSWTNFLTNLSGGGIASNGEPIIFGNRPDVMPGPETTFQSCGLGWANVQNAPFRRYKRDTYEGGVATPLIMHWPDYINGKGGFIHTPGHIIDIMSTLVDISGASYPETNNGNDIVPMEGVSLLELMEDESYPVRPIFFEHINNRGLLYGQWKLIGRGGQRPPENINWELYDFDKDRNEMDNVASEHPDVTSKLAAMWEEWAWRTNVFPKP